MDPVSSQAGERPIRRGARALALALSVGLLLPASWLTTSSPAEAAPSATYVRSVPDPWFSGHAGLYGWGATTMLDGSVLISDYRNYRIAHYAKNGAYLGTFAENPGSAPYGMGMDPRNGNIYLADTDRGIIKKFDPSGNFLLKWGALGTGVGKFQYPSRVAVASDGRVYVGDSWADEIVVHDPVGKELFTFGTTGTANGQLQDPHGMAFDGQDRLFVVDSMNFRIQVFDKAGNFLYKFGSKGTGPGQFRGDLRGLAIDKAKGWVYVVDAGGNKIHKYTLSGSFLTSWGGDGTGPGQFVDGGREATVDGDGNLWVGDMPNYRAQKFSPQGAFLLQVPDPPAPPPDGGFAEPRGVAVDGSGNLFVTDTYNQRIQKFDADGNFVTKWGARGQGSYSFNYARMLATDPRNDDVVVADTDNHLIKKFTNDGTFVWESGGSGSTLGLFRNPQGVDVGPDGRIYVADSTNARVQILGANGAFLGAFGSKGTAAGQFTFPRGIAVDPDGTLWVADTSDWISHFDTNGTYLGRIGGPGTADDQLQNPFDVESDGTHLYVADTASDKIKIWKKDGTFVMAFGASGAGPGQMAGPMGLDLGQGGSLFIAEQDNERISEWSVSLDAPPKGPTSSASSPSITNSPSFTVAYNATPGGSPVTEVELWAKGPGDAAFVKVATDTTPASNSFAYNAAGDGAYRFYTRARDGSGNHEAAPPSEDSSTVLDTSIPVAPVIGSWPKSPGNELMPSWEFTEKATATFECSLMRGTTTIEPSAPCDSPHQYDVSQQTDGSYKFVVRQRDEAGNLGPAATKFYRLDTAVPVSQASGPSNVSARTFNLTYTASDTGAGLKEVELWAKGPGDPSFVQVDTDTTLDTPSFQYTAAGDGAHSFYTRARDLATNHEAPASVPDATVNVATSTPGSVSITESPQDPGNAGLPRWAFSGQAGMTFQCRLTQNGTVLRAWTACTSPRSYDLRSQPDVFYSFSVREKDPSGVLGLPTTDEYLLDRKVPSSTVQGPSSTSDPTIELGYVANDDSSGVKSVELWVMAPGASSFVLAQTDDSIGSASFTYQAGGDGSYSFYTRAGDAAGNYESAPATPDETTVLDSTPPEAPGLTLLVPSPGNDETPSWSIEGEPDATFRCTLSQGANVLHGPAACASPKSYDLSSRSDGTFTLSASQVDAHGNEGPSAHLDYVLDRSAPSSSASAPATSDSRTLSVAYAATDVGSGVQEVELWAKGPGASAFSLADTDTTPSSASFQYIAPSDGIFSFYTRARDVVGNYEGAPGAPDATVSVAATALQTVRITEVPTDPGNAADPSWSFAGQPGIDLQCRLVRGETIVDAWSPCTSPRSYDLASKPDGAYTFSVREVDALGTTGPVSTDEYLLDRGAPSSSVQGPALSSLPSIALDYVTADASSGTSSVELWVMAPGTSSFVLAQTDASPGTPSFNYTHGGDGSYSFYTRARDAAGNYENAASVPDSTTIVDTTAPAAPLLSSTTTSPSSDSSPGWSFEGEAGANFICSLTRGTTVVHAAAACESPKAYDLSARPDGNYTFSVKQVDAVGNSGVAASADYLLDRGAPSSVAAAPATSTSLTFAVTYGSTDGGSGVEEVELWIKGPGAANFMLVGTDTTTGTPSFDYTAPTDGVYALYTRARDSAGNYESAPAGADASVTVTTTSLQPVEIIETPVDPGNDAKPTWSFTGQPGGTFHCRVTRGATIVKAWSLCTSPRMYDLRTQIDGTYTFWARQMDPVLNKFGPAASDNYLLDRAVPASQAETASVAGDSTIAMDYSATDTSSGVASVELWVRAPGAAAFSLAETDATPASASFAYVPTGGDGTYAFYTRARDLAGNYEAAPATADTTALVITSVPQGVEITSTPADPGRDSTPTWAFEGQAGGEFECQLTRSTIVVSPWNGCASPFEHDLTSQVDGTYRFSVREVGASGSPGPTSFDDYLLDRIAPDSSAASAVWSSGSTIAIAYGATDASSGVGSVELWVRTPGASGFTLAGTDDTMDSKAFVYDPSAGDGTYSFYTRARNLAGNYEAPPATFDASVNVDETAPASQAQAPGSSSTKNLTVGYSATDGGAGVQEVELWARGPGQSTFQLVSTDTTPGTASFAYTATADGAYSFYTRARDAAGNHESAPPGPDATTIVDTAPPAAPQLSALTSSPGSSTSPAWSFAGEAGGTFQCSLARGATVIHAFASCVSSKSYDLSLQPDGAYTFSVRQVDAAGNVGAIATGNYLLDRTIPTSSASSPGMSHSSTLTITYAATDSGSGLIEVELWARGPNDSSFSLVALDTSPTSASFSFTADDRGVWDFYTRARDAAGNYEAAPSIEDSSTRVK